jgi:hypothetical protein
MERLAWALLVASASGASTGTAPRLTFKADGTFKILHLSDVHYRIADGVSNGPCRDIINATGLPCSGADNTTDFIQRLIEVEKPDLVVRHL